jgi:large subunit ribosomal protein L18
MNKLEKRQKIRYRIRSKVSGTSAKPRLSVFRSMLKFMLSLLTIQQELLWPPLLPEKRYSRTNSSESREKQMVGSAIARKAVERGITTCVFDRGGNLYHGRVKAVADGAREAGLQF